MNNASTYFVNPSGGNGDYRLNVTSPAIDAGNGDSAPGIDKDGVVRPQGNNFDIGCYEFTDASEVTESNNPESFHLFQNYPNPFNPGTIIQYEIASRQYVTLKVYDVLGNELATLVNENKAAGIYKVNFNASHLPSGMYIYKILSDNFSDVKKMLLLK
ncbi:MAG: T9SS type A sorting domain-containing protein [Ignavibacterium sp.]|nr:MAG: T9SS type A sorting domain-containing protein [Ignavibacterium sp.]